MNLISIQKKFPQAIFAAIITVLIVAGIASATTIGTNISTDGSLSVTGTTTIDSGVLYINVTNDRVGIGTTTPNFKLDVNGDINISNNYSIKQEGYAIFTSSSTTGNLFAGVGSGDSTITGSGNSFFGKNSGSENISGSANTFFGYLSGFANTASYNTFIGAQAGVSNTSGHSNTFLGDMAGNYNTTGDYNVAIGMAAGQNMSGGNNNVFIGYAAGYNGSSTGNIFLGNEAGYGETMSNRLYITNSNTTATNTLIYGEFDNNILSFAADVGIGTTTPDADLQVYGGDVATSTIEIGGSSSDKGACIKLRDSDGAGWSYCTVLNGILSCSQNSCE